MCQALYTCCYSNVSVRVRVGVSVSVSPSVLTIRPFMRKHLHVLIGQYTSSSLFLQFVRRFGAVRKRVQTLKYDLYVDIVHYHEVFFQQRYSEIASAVVNIVINRNELGVWTRRRSN